MDIFINDFIWENQFLLSLLFVTDLSQKFFPDVDILFTFDPFGLKSVDDANYSPPEFGFGDDDFHRICRCAKDLADFGHIFNCIQNIDGK